MRVSLTLSVDVDDELTRCIALESGCAPDEVTPEKAEKVLGTRLLENIDRVIGEIGFDKIPVTVIRQRVYNVIARGHQKGTTPIIGASDKELCALLQLPANSVRWSRYWLQQNGLIYEAGRRSTGKFWRITDKQAPPEFNLFVSNDPTTPQSKKISPAQTLEASKGRSTNEGEGSQEVERGGECGNCGCDSNKCVPRKS